MKLTPPLPEGISEAVSYAASHGILVAQSKATPPGTNITHAPITYLPTPLDASCYHHGVAITPDLNSLLTNIARDPAYLRRVLAETAAADAEFTGRLLQLLPDKRDEIELSIFRYDYFVHEEDAKKSLKMVEMNCIAASFGCLGTKTSQMHRFLAQHPAVGADIDVTKLPPNDAMGGVAGAIACAHAEYAKLWGEGRVTVMVGQSGERNAYDQYLLRKELWERFGVDMIRLSLGEIWECGRVDEEGELSVEVEERGGRVGVSVVYFRAGYTPEDYVGEGEWKARAMIERSRAAKCPSVAMQLVGTKKIQQVLDGGGEVERFLKGGVEEIRRTFVRQYALEDAVVEMGIERPGDFVLKPQREGGGNNLYGEELRAKLMEVRGGGEREAYVLMERIRPVVERNWLIREGVGRPVDVVSEFGVFGVYVAVGGDMVRNCAGGTLLRSKPAEQDDGGVASGVAVLDSPLLVE